MPCKVEGCNGFFGPGCMVSHPHPLFFKCEGNRRFYDAVFNEAKPKGKTDMNLPDQDSIQLVRSKGQQVYRVQIDGAAPRDFPRTTHVIDYLDLKGANGQRRSENLIKWAANQEREAVIEAVVMAAEQTPYVPGQRITHREFKEGIEKRLGPARKHQKLLEKAGEIGTAVHKAIQAYTNHGSTAEITEEVAPAFHQWLTWRDTSGLKTLAVEIKIYEPERGYAGTIDEIAEAEGVEIVDYKTSAGVYLEHHIQLAAYREALMRRIGEPVRARIIHLPKKKGDHLSVHELGHINGKVYSPEQLMRFFDAALMAWNASQEG